MMTSYKLWRVFDEQKDFTSVKLGQNPLSIDLEGNYLEIRKINDCNTFEFDSVCHLEDATNSRRSCIKIHHTAHNMVEYFLQLTAAVLVDLNRANR